MTDEQAARIKELEAENRRLLRAATFTENGMYDSQSREAQLRDDLDLHKTIRKSQGALLHKQHAELLELRRVVDVLAEENANGGRSEHGIITRYPPYATFEELTDDDDPRTPRTAAADMWREYAYRTARADLTEQGGDE